MQTDDYAVVREWALDVLNDPGQTNPRMRTVAKTILDLLPKTTIADIGFDFDKHHLAGATSSDGDEVVMLWLDDIESGLIICETDAWEPKALTPNGKRYELREVGEVDEPGHPETLTTAEDYADAPVGTIVANNGHLPCAKRNMGDWVDTLSTKHTHNGLAGASRRVLRWGWGA